MQFECRNAQSGCSADLLAFKYVEDTSGLQQNPENKNVSASEEEKETKTTKVMREHYNMESYSKKPILHGLSKSYNPVHLGNFFFYC